MYRFASPCCELPKDWKGKNVYFHVGSTTSNLTLWMNGKYVGYSEDGKADVIIALCDKDGKQIASATGTQGVIKVPKVKDWTAETPYLYKVYISLKNKPGVAEMILQKVGFRNVEIKNAQLLVNGKPVLIKGVNRHEWRWRKLTLM